MYTPVKINKLEIEKAYQNVYGDKYKEDCEYKFIILLCEEFPEFVISSEFPKSLLTDCMELIYEIMADNLDKLTQNKNLLKKFTRFVDRMACETKYENCINDILWGIRGTVAENQINMIISLFGEKTRSIWGDLINKSEYCRKKK